MKTSPAGLELIQQFEGFSALPYLCPAGWWTIGYGHVIAPSERDALQFVEPARAERLLAVDVGVAERAVAQFITVVLRQPQYDALVSFTFNAGAAALQRSSLRRVVNRGEHDAVPTQLMRWVWGGGRKLPGLARRRAAEASLYLS